MPTYFGNQTSTSSDTNYGAVLMWNTATYVCPGSGNQSVKELSAYVYGDGSVKARIGVYNSAGTSLIGQGNSAVTLATSPLAWQGHMNQAAITPNPATLVGGSSYLLACANGAGNMGYGYTTGTVNYVVADYSGGLPASLSGGAASELVCIRCGVDPASAIYPDRWHPEIQRPFNQLREMIPY